MIAEYGFSTERQEIDFSKAPIAEFTARFARWIGFRGIDKNGGGNRRKYAVRKNMGLKFNRNRDLS